ncbi:glycosyltransferase family 4 protein [Dendronalium sp. ChiSLP03b]|uniref:glycosyltransferase family 4 protein n=1 Tax=Dendronalium sp. ChiSLP03b TaxID=3075381 RepID=UPI002AD27AB4|nr:glycosyltransferase family 4 protein [Dendronalium sp. ChiSLP03b]MDZ8202854.1 glycosyltransferase family 4 protein [Dendronalium sp. ChiSLP03b]
MTNADFKLLWLRESFPWMGQHSGYEQVCNLISELQQGSYQSVWMENKPLPRIAHHLLKPIVAKVKRSGTYNTSSTLVELKALWHILTSKCDLAHVIYLERTLGILPKWQEKFSFKLIATAHQPAGLWRMQRHHPEMLSSLDGLIVLSSKEVEYFDEYIPGRVHFIPHGVDIEFFCPQTDKVNSTVNRDRDYPRCVFSGIWLRDLQALAQVIDEVLAREPRIRFDLIVPADRRENPHFFRIARHSQVTWYAGISDAQLRDLYCQASMLVLPLLDCTANNALLEAIACGLPIVSNDVGGIPDYTQDSFAKLLPIGDIDGFVEAILRLANDPQECVQKGVAARTFAEQNLRWEKIAAQTINVYQKVLSAY